MQETDEIFNNSIINKKFIEFLNNDEVTTISFDIFDTMFFRVCGSPTKIFDIVGNKQNIKEYYFDKHLFTNYRIAAEKTARENRITEEVTLKDIYNYYPGLKDFKEQLYNLEIKTENENLILNKHIYSWMKLAKKHNKKIILISDMYLSENEINTVALNKVPNLKMIDKIYISSEIGYTKASSNLYKHILSNLKIKPENLLHIGDNFKSDIESAKNLKIKTMHYNYDKKRQEAIENERIYLKEEFIEKDQTRFLSYIANPYIKKEESFFYELGSTIFGPLIFNFCIWLNKISKTHGSPKINFLMREGYTFKKVYDLLFPENESDLIRISRSSTNFLAFSDKDLNSINTHTIKNFKIKDYYELLNLEIYKKEIKEVEHYLFEEINNKELILNDLKSRVDEIKIKIDDQRVALSRYFYEKKINEKSIFVDLGGRGTVFSRLNNLYFKNNNGNKFDILLFSLPKLYHNNIKVPTMAFIPYNKSTEYDLDTISRTPYLLEILLNGYNLSAKKYRTKNNSYEIIERDLSYHTNHLESQLSAFLNGVINYAKITKELNGLKVNHSKKHLISLITRLIRFPTKNESSILGKLKHDEGQGTDENFPLIRNLNKTSINYNDLYLKHINNPLETIEEFPWLEGYITLNSPKTIRMYLGYPENQNEKRVNSIINKIDKYKINEVSVYGAGELFKQLLPHLIDRKVKINNIFDSRAKIEEFAFLDFNVLDFDKTPIKETDTIIIASVAFYENIKEYILSKKPNYKII